MKRLTGTVAVTATALSGGLLAGGSPAAADGYVNYTADAVLIRTDAYLSAPAVGQGYPGDATTYACWRSGDPVLRNGTYYYFWLYHANHTRGVKGFSSEAYAYAYWYSSDPMC